MDSSTRAEASSTATSPSPIGAYERGNPDVLHGFGLGWHVAQLYTLKLQPEKPAANDVPDDLPGVGDLSTVSRARLLCTEIGVSLRQLTGVYERAGLRQPSLASLKRELNRSGPRHAQVKQAILRLHESLLSGLTAADASVGKAYGLGRALADTTLRPSPARPQAFTQAFGRYRIENLCNSLDDLDSLFPRYAADAVRSSLQGWRYWVAGSTQEVLKDQTATQVLRDQGRVWRALLSGERQPEDLLESTHYVHAAINLVNQMRVLVWQFVRSWGRIILPAAGLLAAAIVLIFVFLTGSSETAGAIAAVVAGIGVTWKTVGSTLGRALSRAEEPVWRAEVGASINVAVSRVEELERRVQRHIARGEAPNPQGASDH